MKGIAVRLEGLTKHFGKVVALQALDLDVRAGEMVAFLGPSGCGKTTTLLMIAGIYRPTAGAIYFGDRRVDHLHPRDRDVGMVFQSYALYPHLTIFENIAFPLRLKGMRGEAVAARVRQSAELLGIAHILERRPAQVSGGQQQRAALARALVKEPQVLLLDEPLSNLDAQIRLQARGEIRRLQLDLGVTSVLVTHDQAEALAMADRVAVFSMGELQQFASPHDLYTRPANTFVAGFVGHPPMNLISGAFAGGVFVHNDLRIPVAFPAPAGEGTLGVRPEDLRPGSGPIRGRVVVVESLGRQVLVTLEAGGATLKVLTDLRPAVGATMDLAVDPARCHLFDARGRRIEGRA
ncbi:MAG: ABC transporter ATP-binding protein [Armatimonadota bacterium]|nr:ABC transporter ATP-binding protein [Armatimonadota bacterium]MDR7452797.1 ABC transporter ATP-binding protein [Armatimonadota bacterium]MDR7468224.1 ABC transporter ATP-binding protein [Armatimonadota bacterium]MDR7494302.1 ABC transporter ATP-binding protein [Armatimonadota bacterium]MDR7500529.1 ABC transporter ATP-binding protein [Armatimonadota bacterium]